MELSPTAIYPILRQCPGLVSCAFLISLDAVIPNDSRLTLQHLTEMRLTASHPIDWDNFISQLTTPSLKSLVIRGPQVTPHTFKSLIIRSNCTLESATFRTNDHEAFDDPGVDSLMEHLMTVTMLNLSAWIIPASVVRKMHKDVLPRLHWGAFVVRPDGLDAFLDFIDEFTRLNVNRVNKVHSTFLVTCTRGPGYERVRERYRMYILQTADEERYLSAVSSYSRRARRNRHIDI
jgi:hypothetical protein